MIPEGGAGDALPSGVTFIAQAAMAYHFSKHIIPAAVIFMAVMQSCICEDLPPCGDDKVEITIVNDWNGAPDAAPEGMAYEFYRAGLTSPWRFDFPGREAGRVALEEGEYRFVMYNDDTSDVIFEAGRDGLPFVTTACDMMGRDGHDTGLRKAPDMMWGCSAGMIGVSRDGLEYLPDGKSAGCNDRFILLTHPVQITPVYTVRVLRVANLSGVASMKGVISGMASGVELYDEVRSDTAVGVTFSPEAVADSSLMARFCTFGPCGNGAGHELRLYFLLSDQRLVSRSYDVTPDVASAKDPMHVEIVIDSISLPFSPPVIEGGAFDPEVVDWTTIIVNYGV